MMAGDRELSGRGKGWERWLKKGVAIILRMRIIRIRQWTGRLGHFDYYCLLSLTPPSLEFGLIRERVGECVPCVCTRVVQASKQSKANSSSSSGDLHAVRSSRISSIAAPKSCLYTYSPLSPKLELQFPLTSPKNSNSDMIGGGPDDIIIDLPFSPSPLD